MNFQQTIGWILETTDWIGLTAKSTKSDSFKPFSKTSKCQTTDWNDKTTGCFSLLYKTILLKKVLIPNCFRFKQRVDYTSFHPKLTHTNNNSNPPSNTMDLETSKLQDHPWSTYIYLKLRMTMLAGLSHIKYTCWFY